MQITILTVIGARPQIIKAAAIGRAIRNHFSNQLREVIVHTGQHYDEGMSEVFFRELGISSPDRNLNVGSGPHGKQTATMIQGIEEAILAEKPNCVLIYGDTNSTLAAAIAASKLQVPVVHIEAGLRSFNKKMPEEINRMVSDQVSTLLFAPTRTAVQNLLHEGIQSGTGDGTKTDLNHPKVFHCGDVMYDNSLFFADVAEKQVKIIDTLGLEKNKFLLATVHRDFNTDNKERLGCIFQALLDIAENRNTRIVLPLHPRTQGILDQMLEPEILSRLKASTQLMLIKPVSFLEMLMLEKHCRMILTDSGGLQKEAFFFKKACIVLRPETEWVELVENGNAVLADADSKKIQNAYNYFIGKNDLKFPEFYGDGKAAEFICGEIIRAFS